MEPTINTLDYMIAGYIVFTVIMTGYLVNLYQRWQNLKNELNVLDETEKK